MLPTVNNHTNLFKNILNKYQPFFNFEMLDVEQSILKDGELYNAVTVYINTQFTYIDAKQVNAGEFINEDEFDNYIKNQLIEANSPRWTFSPEVANDNYIAFLKSKEQQYS